MEKNRELKEQIKTLVERIKRYDYKVFSSLLSEEHFNILKGNSINNLKNDSVFLLNCKLSIEVFLDFIKSVNLDLFKYITNNILKGEQLNIEDINKIIDYHFDISIIFFKYISKFEQAIKNKIIWYANQKGDDYFFNLIVYFIKKYRNKRFKFLIKRVSQTREIEFATNHNYSYELISEFGFNDLIEFFSIVKNKKHKNEFKILDFLRDLFGDNKFEKIYQATKLTPKTKGKKTEKNDIIVWFITQLNLLKMVRNKVMHNRVLFSSEEKKYDIKHVIITIKNLSYQKNSLGSQLLAEVNDLTKKLNQQVKNKNLKEFLMREILNN